MQTPGSSRITYIALRYMRRPILVLITVYAVSMVGWILIPGLDEEGNPQNLSFFHAFYFLTYTVTTTGFGELPHAFTDAQRMWGIVSLYAGVIAWFYALGSIIGLVQNPEYQRAIAERRFTRHVARIAGPFCIVCGYGNTGALLTRGLSEAGMTVVVIDKNPERIKTLQLRDYRADIAGLPADARVPEHLIEAGLRKKNCHAVVALTQDEEVNLKISVAARVLNPNAWIVTQSTSPAHEETLATLGENLHIIDPFQTYAKYLEATIANPLIHTLNQWLAGTPGATLDQVLRPPRGTWIVCGYGRMGRRIRGALEAEGITTVIIEPEVSPGEREVPRLIVGRANQDSLQEAGVSTAAGIVAGTDSDPTNLGILLNAKALNPGIFFVVRQNRYRNQVVFQGADADLVMMPSLVSARRMLFVLIAPMMKSFFEGLRDGAPEESARRIAAVVEELEAVVGGTQPRVWSVEITEATGSAVIRTAAAGRETTLGHLLRDPVDRDRRLECVALALRSGGREEILPGLSTPVAPGDRILFCASARAQHLLDATMNNEYVLSYLITGVDPPRGWFMQWAARKCAPKSAVAGP